MLHTLSTQLDFHSLNEVIKSTSDSKRPLLPFTLLPDAKSAFNKDNFRKAVLDAATALEVCFSYVIDNSLNFNKEIDKYPSKKHNSLRLKRELLEVLEVQLPFTENQFKREVDEVRNRIIHAGYVSSKTEARREYDIAKSTLN